MSKNVSFRKIANLKGKLCGEIVVLLIVVNRISKEKDSVFFDTDKFGNTSKRIEHLNYKFHYSQVIVHFGFLPF